MVVAGASTTCTTRTIRTIIRTILAGATVVSVRFVRLVVFVRTPSRVSLALLVALFLRRLYLSPSLSPRIARTSLPSVSST